VSKWDAMLRKVRSNHVVVKYGQSSISSANKPIGGMRRTYSLILTFLRWVLMTLIKYKPVIPLSAARKCRVKGWLASMNSVIPKSHISDRKHHYEGCNSCWRSMFRAPLPQSSFPKQSFLPFPRLSPMDGDDRELSQLPNPWKPLFSREPFNLD
jgi:hypothetical protein